MPKDLKQEGETIGIPTLLSTCSPTRYILVGWCGGEKQDRRSLQLMVQLRRLYPKRNFRKLRESCKSAPTCLPGGKVTQATIFLLAFCRADTAVENCMDQIEGELTTTVAQTDIRTGKTARCHGLMNELLFRKCSESSILWLIMTRSNQSRKKNRMRLFGDRN